MNKFSKNRDNINFDELDNKTFELIRGVIKNLVNDDSIEITDEIVRIVLCGIPISGMTEDGTLWDGYKNYYDNDIKQVVLNYVYINNSKTSR